MLGQKAVMHGTSNIWSHGEQEWRTVLVRGGGKQGTTSGTMGSNNEQSVHGA